MSDMLMVSRQDLKDMLEEMQEDGLGADGCRYDLGENAGEVIDYYLSRAVITPIPDRVADKIADYADGLTKTIRTKGLFPRTDPCTNGDRIRSMTNEELARWLASIERRVVYTGSTMRPDAWKTWLECEIKKKGGNILDKPGETDT